MFNCQMGRGRTTTGMIIASLLHLLHRSGLPGARPPSTSPLGRPYSSATGARTTHSSAMKRRVSGLHYL